MANASTRKYILKILPFASVALFFGAWQVIVDVGIVPRVFLATPTDVVKLLVVKLYQTKPDGALLVTHTWVSLQEAVYGYMLALAFGVPLGLLMGWFYTIEGLARPLFEMIRPIPAVAWIPLTIFWFGIGMSGKVFIIWLSGIVPCVINSFTGVKLTNPTLIQMARTYGATKWQIFYQICIPSALPMVFGALQIALAACWTTLVAAELIAADTGLGFLITMGRRLVRPDMVVLGMMMVGLTGFVIGIVVDLIEKRLLAGIRR
ncbi:taurine ABC transporter permease [Desulfosarcina alkanivorans]|uniref:Taurine ABC transporter permease n=1 Tax=Desulfosarcina alkanivorans TaxID=571177 RepID=A0A5K7YHM0_9BACT|nr:ABC transporter permease [Desulfosarcina alkanivorans]BBO67895.1 taurine ABC transporter permease [Desulfosarcina alkanivorans]